jgi:hypothetical protein
MAMRRSALTKVGGFHRGLGRRGGQLLSNEELHVKHLLEASGYYTIFSADVVVQHFVPKERMSVSWFRRRFYWQGISDALTGRLLGENPSRLPAGSRSWIRNSISMARISRRIFWRRLPIGKSAYNLLDDLHDHEKLGSVVGSWPLLLKLSRIGSPP